MVYLFVDICSTYASKLRNRSETLLAKTLLDPLSARETKAIATANSQIHSMCTTGCTTRHAIHMQLTAHQLTVARVWNNAPKYLVITLDRILTYWKHCLNTKQKAATRNKILRKLNASDWVIQPQTIRATALSLCYFTAEYSSAMWYKRTHAKQGKLALNETCRIIIGCLKPSLH